MPKPDAGLGKVKNPLHLVLAAGLFLWMSQAAFGVYQEESAWEMLFIGIVAAIVSLICICLLAAEYLQSLWQKGVDR